MALPHLPPARGRLGLLPLRGALPEIRHGPGPLRPHAGIQAGVPHRPGGADGPAEEWSSGTKTWSRRSARPRTFSRGRGAVKEAFTDWRPRSSANKALLVASLDVIEEYAGQGYRLTLRQLYYQLVARDIIPNQDTWYKRLGEVVSNGRLGGYVDWDAIVDRGRTPVKPPDWSSPGEVLESAARSYRVRPLARPGPPPGGVVREGRAELGHRAGVRPLPRALPGQPGLQLQHRHVRRGPAVPGGRPPGPESRWSSTWGTTTPRVLI